MNYFPEHKEIPVETLASIFNDTTNSYKYYWFLAIIDILQSRDVDEISIDELCEKMIESVWYPLNFFKLSFGSQDKFKDVIELINLHIDIESSNDSIILQVYSTTNNAILNQIKSNIKQLARWVPYRFLRPFLNNGLKNLPDQQVNNAIILSANKLSIQNSNLVPYYFVSDKIVINKPWKDYLMQNIGLIKGFTFWNLVKFVQKNNPNVPGISEKLFKPSIRNLALNNKSWNFYFEQNHGIQCVYSKNPVPMKFSLDHFIPWTYTVHDLNWNILPVSKDINSSKSNNLPSLDRYLADFVSLQYDFFSSIYGSCFEHKNKILEHYILLFKDSASNIYNLPKAIFDDKLVDTIIPMVQIATNMGFRKDWVYDPK